MQAALVTIALMLLGPGSHAGDKAQAAAPAATAASAARPARGGSPTPYRAPIQVPSAAGQIRAPDLRTAPVTVTPAAPPTFSGNCDSSGCWGSDGTRYNAIGGALVRPDGRMCQNVGGVVQCP